MLIVDDHDNICKIMSKVNRDIRIYMICDRKLTELEVVVVKLSEFYIV